MRLNKDFHNKLKLDDSASNNDFRDILSDSKNDQNDSDIIPSNQNQNNWLQAIDDNYQIAINSESNMSYLNIIQEENPEKPLSNNNEANFKDKSFELSKLSNKS